MRGRSLSTPSKGCRVVDYYTRRDSTVVFHLHMWSYTCTQSSIENYYIVNPDTCDSIHAYATLFQATYEVYSA